MCSSDLIDPVKEKQGAVLGMDAALSTLEEECAAQGLDWEENVEQRSYEIERFKEHGIPLPKWAGEEVTAEETITRQQPE